MVIAGNPSSIRTITTTAKSTLAETVREIIHPTAASEPEFTPSPILGERIDDWTLSIGLISVRVVVGALWWGIMILPPAFIIFLVGGGLGYWPLCEQMWWQKRRCGCCTA